MAAGQSAKEPQKFAAEAQLKIFRLAPTDAASNLFSKKLGKNQD